MYTRSPTQGGPRGVRIPRNYSGNAFAAPQAPQEEPSPTEIEEPVSVASADRDGTHATEDQPTSPPKEAPAAKLFPSLGVHPGKLLGSFGTEELLARVRAALRNSRQFAGEGGVRNSFTTNGLVIEYDSRRIMVNGEEVKLTQTEYNIVELLSIHAGRVLTYTEIINKIWRYADSGSIKKLQVNMANIRKKLGEKPGENQYIANELGVGYRMTNNN